MNKNTKSRNLIARKGGQKNKQDTTFTVPHTKGNYSITVAVRAHGRVSKVPKVGASAEKYSRVRNGE